MSNPFDAFGQGLFGPGGGNLRDSFEQLRTSFEQRMPRMGRGDVRAAVLALLAEQPMHGYQIIGEIAERSGGAWKPSPGSVYPTLQLLADEGLVEASEQNGRKTYSLTDEGRAAAESASGPAPWETPGGWRGHGGRHSATHASGLPKAGIDLAQAAASVARAGTAEQQAEAAAVLEEARRKLYSILAQG